MMISRRSFILLSLYTSAQQLQQGIATRELKPQAKPEPSGKPFNAHFVDIAHAAGLRQPTTYGGLDTKKCILEANGCGCAFFDYDNDGWIDIFVLCGTRLEGDPPEATNRLYKNNRDGTFTDVTKESGLWQSEARWGAGCAFVDYDRDGHLDLFVSNYVRFSLEHAPLPGENATCNWKGIPVNCGPRGLPMGRHSLYRNNGDGTFTDVTKQAGIANANEGYGMTVVAADLDEDGWQDILVASDSTPTLLFMNNHDGTFREEGIVRGVAFSDDGMEQAGMGVGIGDYDLDGHLDLFKTHFMDDSPGFYHNDGKGNFDDVTRLTKVGTVTQYICWGTGLVDFDNDGYPDVLVATGSVYPEVERKLQQYPYKSPRLLFRNLGNGTFEEVGSAAGDGMTTPHASRGCAFGDFDNDGDMDVLIVNMNEPPCLLRNDVNPKQHWIKVKLEGVKSNRSAIGARVLLHYGGKTQAQAVVSQSSYESCNDSRLHFGLGSETSVSIDIHWPSGLHETYTGISVDQLVTFREGKGQVANRGWAR